MLPSWPNSPRFPLKICTNLELSICIPFLQFLLEGQLVRLVFLGVKNWCFLLSIHTLIRRLLVASAAPAASRNCCMRRRKVATCSAGYLLAFSPRKILATKIIRTWWVRYVYTHRQISNGPAFTSSVSLKEGQTGNALAEGAIWGVRGD